MEDDIDPLGDPLTRDIIGVLTGAITARQDESSVDDEQFTSTLGTLVTQLMPQNLTIRAGTTAEQAAQEIAKDLSAHMVRLVTCFTFLFSELAETNDGAMQISTAEFLQQMSLEIDQRSQDR
ncbi:hypothetical protein [Streptomyces rubiginosohelvolus]